MRPVMDRVKLGVVGVGYLGQYHAEKYAKFDGVELVGVVDIIPSRAEEVARRCSTKAYYDYRELLDKVQAVSIVAPTPFHYPLARDFFLHRIDVLLEKPMTTTLKEAEELVNLAKEKGLILQVGHLERFNSAVLALQEVVNQPMFIEAHRLSPFQGRSTDINVILDLMIHDLDIILSLVDSRVAQVQAVGVPVVSPQLDIANARVTFANGCVANVTCSRVSQTTSRRIRIFQLDAYVTIDYVAQQIVVFRREMGSREGDFPRIVKEKLDIAKGDSLEKELAAFVHSVRDRARPLVSGEEGKRVLEVALHIQEEIANFADTHWGAFQLPHPPRFP